jgi:hypothetical protein
MLDPVPCVLLQQRMGVAQTAGGRWREVMPRKKGTVSEECAAVHKVNFSWAGDQPMWNPNGEVPSAECPVPCGLGYWQDEGLG